MSTFTSRRFGVLNTTCAVYVLYLNIIVKFISTSKKIMVPHAISSLFPMLFQQIYQETYFSHTTNEGNNK